jgi:hypothetical protein
MPAVGERGILEQQTTQPLLALDQRQLPQVLTVKEYDVEHAVMQVGLRSERVLQQLKPGHVMIVEESTFSTPTFAKIAVKAANAAESKARGESGTIV